MIVSIASGKGGTGKTTVTSSLVSVWNRPVIAVDLDVEEPNLHLFLRHESPDTQVVSIEIPVVDREKCSLCRACSDLCQFKAISVLGSRLMVFPEMCHGCGGCMAVCPEKAVLPGAREVGTIHAANIPGGVFLMGRLRVGEAMSVPLIRAVRKKMRSILSVNDSDVIIDAPPGASCPAVNSVMDSDLVLLVTEPTPFGFHDFKLAWEAFAPLGRRIGAVVNRAGGGYGMVHDFCRDRNIPILAEIPFNREIAENYSRGRIVAEVSDGLRQLFEALRDKIVNGSEAAYA